MEVFCPECSRPVRTSKNASKGPTQQIRCDWCGSYFTLQRGTPISTGEFRKVNQKPADEAEVWEFSADEELSDLPPLDPSSLFDDFDDISVEGSLNSSLEHDVNAHMELYPTENLSGGFSPRTSDIPNALPITQEPQIPDLPSTSGPALDQLGHNWSSMGDVSKDVPELPDFGDMQFQDASPSSVSQPQQKKVTPPGGSISYEENLSPKSSTDAAKPIMSKPKAAPQEQSVEDLIKGFLDSGNTDDELLLRYYIRRAKKDYGPFTEEEIHSLLEVRKLSGDEPSRLQNETKWLPLRERPDFKPTIEILEKQPVRVGWESKSPLPAEVSEELPNAIEQDDIQTLTLSELGPESLADIDTIESLVAEAQARSTETPQHKNPQHNNEEHKEKPSGAPILGDLKEKLSDVRVLGGLIAALMILLASIWWLVPAKKKVKSGPIKELPIAQTLTINDQFTTCKKLLNQLTTSYRKGTFQKSWYNIRFVYYLLDAHGDDRTIRADADPILHAIQKNKKGSLLLPRIELAQAISLNSIAKIRTALEKLPKPLPSKHPEWGYLLGRAKERLEQTKEAQKIYAGIVQKYPKHIRALLGLYRIHMKLKEESAAARYLWNAFHNGPENLPAQLLAFEYATRTGKWASKKTKLLMKIRSLVQKRNYTQASLAHWYAIVSKQLWQNRKTEKATHRIEQASTLSPENMSYFIQKIRFYSWSRQYYQALREIQKKQRKYPLHPELLQLEFNLLYATDQAHKIPNRLTKVQQLSKTPPEKYLMYYLLGQYYEKKKRIQEAISSYKQARNAEPGRTTNTHALFALVRLYTIDKRWKKVARLLKSLRKTQPISIETNAAWGKFLLTQKKTNEAIAIAKKMRKQDYTRFEGYLLASKAHEQKNQIKKSISYLRRALYLHPWRPSPLLLKLSDLYNLRQEPNKALRSLQQYEKLLQGSTPCPFLRRKVHNLEQLGMCQKLVRIKIKHCRHFQLYISFGKCLEKLGKNGEAVTKYKRARLLYPELSDPIQALAKIYEKMGELSKSSQLYKILLQKKPSQKASLMAIIRMYEQKKKYSQAWRLMRNHRQLFKNDFDFNLSFARIQANTGRKRQALRLLKKLLFTAKTKGQTSLIHEHLAQVYSQQNKKKAALRSYKNAIQYAPKRAEPYLGQAGLYYRFRKYPACIKAAQMFIKKANKRHKQKGRAELLLRTCKNAAKK